MQSVHTGKGLKIQDVPLQRLQTFESHPIRTIGNKVFYGNSPTVHNEVLILRGAFLKHVSVFIQFLFTVTGNKYGYTKEQHR